MLLAQDKATEAEALLAEARSRSPRDMELWVKSAEVLRRQHKYIGRRGSPGSSPKVGDTVSLRIERAQLLVARGGADLSKALGALAENTNAFPPADAIACSKRWPRRSLA